jgi:hypothetical protein
MCGNAVPQRAARPVHFSGEQEVLFPPVEIVEEAKIFLASTPMRPLEFRARYAEGSSPPDAELRRKGRRRASMPGPRSSFNRGRPSRPVGVQKKAKKGGKYALRRYLLPSGIGRVVGVLHRQCGNPPNSGALSRQVPGTRIMFLLCRLPEPKTVSYWKGGIGCFPTTKRARERSCRKRVTPARASDDVQDLRRLLEESPWFRNRVVDDCWGEAARRIRRSRGRPSGKAFGFPSLQEQVRALPGAVCLNF